MLKRKSIYFLNKSDANAIVYTDASGSMIRLTASDFSSEEEFQRWKEWSDNDFHEEDKKDHIYDDNNLSLERMSEFVAPFPSAEAMLERKERNRAREQYTAEAILTIRKQLTERQFRRVWFYFVCGLTERQIAVMECVGQQRISKYIIKSVNKLKTFLRADQNRG